MIRISPVISLFLLASAAPALAAPPASCAAKFVGDWRHSGSGNRGSVLRDGRALCSEHPACVQGTWTCSGDTFTYTNSLGSWNYTLAPDGRTISTGTATATRIGPVPAVARTVYPATGAKVSTRPAEPDFVNRVGGTIRKLVKDKVIGPDCKPKMRDDPDCPVRKQSAVGVRG
ncbi:hypothetical protein [Bradyrhizobium sp. 141]|uniref:hypothetical protein n=1 Tax=Bradyrhizobium sp. 141 TaxID=2782617 RepID=UPI001FFBDF90|nr:hypothetical protein [Bradyrhizobium sp. 141]MCK1723290.1 hypothetical protein [Bradyrhizobium sp. 141]